jgi:hypothetical protein
LIPNDVNLVIMWSCNPHAEDTNSQNCEVSNKIHAASVNQYCDAFSNSDWPEILTQSRKTYLETPRKFQPDPMVGLRIMTITVKLDSCAFYVRIRI